MDQRNTVLTPAQSSALDRVLKSGRGPIWIRAAINFTATAITSALGGSVALLAGIGGGFIQAGMSVQNDDSQRETNELHSACIKEIADTIDELKETIGQILGSIKASDEEFAAKVEDPHYVGLVRKAFTNWSRGQSQEKREIIRRLLSRAADTQSPDYPLFNLFFDWVNRYNELHFRLIRSLKEQGTATKFQIWEGMGGERVKDDSAEADVFGCLFNDLNLGHIVRKVTARDGATGRKLRASRTQRSSSPLLKSVLDNTAPQELTAVGEKFIHYAMDELIDKLPSPK
jgi:hypothetical protein